ncbi:MAG: hypothetical protein NTY55_04710 [Flavobacteriia bacterium]|nr:hypothetical protein [Flavobacteriia bacterium]
MFKYLVFFIFLFTKFTVLSQISFTSNQLIEPYLGFPNLGRLSAQIIDTSILEKQDQKFSGIGPSGFRYSYMFSDAFSLGIDLIYNSLSEKYRTSQDVFMNNTWTTINKNMLVSTQRLRIHVRMNFHFSAFSDMSDSYLGLGFGTNNKWKKTSENGNVIEKISGSEAVIFPFSLRLCYGYRYFFNYNWGINGEVGLGGPLLLLGLSYKI